jgi:hypothetical protein
MPNLNLIFLIWFDTLVPDLLILSVNNDTNNWAIEAQCYISRVDEQKQWCQLCQNIHPEKAYR